MPNGIVGPGNTCPCCAVPIIGFTYEVRVVRDGCAMIDEPATNIETAKTIHDP